MYWTNGRGYDDDASDLPGESPWGMAEETVEARAEAEHPRALDWEFQDGGEEEAHLRSHELLEEDTVEEPCTSCYLGALPVELASERQNDEMCEDMRELGEHSTEEDVEEEEAYPGVKEELWEDTVKVEEAHPGFKEELSEDTVEWEAHLRVKEELREDTMEERSSSEAVAYAQPVGCHTEARPMEEESGWI